MKPISAAKLIVFSLLSALLGPMTWTIVVRALDQNGFERASKMVCNDLQRRNITSETETISVAHQLISEFTFARPPKLQLRPTNAAIASNCSLPNGLVLGMSFSDQPVDWVSLLIVWALIFPIALLSFWLFRRKLLKMQAEAINAVEVVISERLGLGLKSSVDFTKRGLVSRLINSDIPLLESLKMYIERQRVSIRSQTLKLAATQSRAEIGEFAAQMAHDISTPIEVISRALNEKSPTSADQSVFAAIQTLRESANDISVMYKCIKSNSPITIFKKARIESVAEQINLIVGQLSNIWPEIAFDLALDGDTPVKMNATAFQAAIRNVLTNAIEAMNGMGRIAILVRKNESQIEVSIKDQGPGIPKERQEAIFEREITFEKPSGSGLGLSQAKQAIENFGGKISVDSSLGHGATFTIALPKMEMKSIERLQKILITPGTQIIVVDDDPLTHYTWKKAFEQIDNSARVQYFFTATEFKKWFIAEKTSFNVVYFIDLEIRERSKTESGLELIKELGLEPFAYLVSGIVFDDGIAGLPSDMSVRMINKVEVPVLKFVNIEDLSDAAIILIDDDPANHFIWKQEGEAQAKKVSTFLTLDEFASHQHIFSRDANVYVDWYLGGAGTGGEVARSVRTLGFKNVRITTGLEGLDLGEYSKEFEVVGKFQPFAKAVSPDGLQ